MAMFADLKLLSAALDWWLIILQVVGSLRTPYGPLSYSLRREGGGYWRMVRVLVSRMITSS